MNQLAIYTRKITDYLDKLSDSITVFRALLYTLISYFLAAIVLSYFGKIPFSTISIVTSVLTLVTVCKISNWIFSKAFKIPINHESDILSGLILAFILTPANTTKGYLILAAAAIVAMLSKFLLTYNGKHIFNPAALGALVSAVVFNNYASWWVGTTYMTPLLIVGGLLMVRKMRRFVMVATFVFSYFIYQLFLEPLFFGGNALLNFHTVYLYLSATPIIFLATIMLTEPLTSPTKLRGGIIYALTVALFYSVSQLHFSPEQALLIGNIAAFAVEPNRSLLLKFIGRRQEAYGVISYFFEASKKLEFSAGQYLEWTLPGVAVDARGNRRYLTISSSPTEPQLMVTVKILPKSSRFKHRLTSLSNGEKILASRLAGEFVLPEDSRKKLVFIAGGVGITPFRSMIKNLIDNDQKRNILLFYFVNKSRDIAFRDILDEAAKLSVTTHYVTTESKEPNYKHGYFNEQFISTYIPNHNERYFFISGSQGFVAAARQTLLAQDVSPRKITTDYFPGYN